MSGKRKKKKRPGWRLVDPDRARAETAPSPPVDGLHFTVVTDVSTDPDTGHLILDNDARLLKAGL